MSYSLKKPPGTHHFGTQPFSTSYGWKSELADEIIIIHQLKCLPSILDECAFLCNFIDGADLPFQFALAFSF